MLSARRALVRARAVGDGSIVAVDREHLPALVQRDAELGEILMRAFIPRRVALISHGIGGLVLVGSRHSASPLRIREFLSHSGQSFTYHEVESEASVRVALRLAANGSNNAHPLSAGLESWRQAGFALEPLIPDFDLKTEHTAP